MFQPCFSLAQPSYPPVPIIEGTFIDCNFAQNNYLMPYEILNYNPNYTYYYTIDAPYGPPINFINSNTFNVDWSQYPNGGILYVTAVNDGWESICSWKVHQCCSVSKPGGNPYPEYNDATINSAPISNYFVINGVLTVNANISLQNKSIYLGPNAKIIVNPGYNLSMYNVTMQAGCDTMWDGIYLNNANNSLNISYCNIKDAKNAVIANECANFSITGTTMTNNYKCVIVNDCPDNNYSGTIHSNTFTCIGTIKPQYPPVYATRTRSGIEINNVFNANSFFNIGLNAANSANYFTNMDYGIKSYLSGIKVRNNHFTDITNQTGEESAIYLEGYPNPMMTDIIGGYNSYEKNYFQNVCFGVRALMYNLNLEVYNNEFINPLIGIVYTLGVDALIKINDNYISNPSPVGIWAFNNYVSYNEILSNEIILSNPGPGYYGIVLQDDVPDTYFCDYLVQENTITAPIGRGISVENIVNPVINYNIINGIVPGTNHAIYLTNCDEPEIVGNRIFHTVAANSTNYGGIYTSLCDNSLIECNLIYDAGYGIRCENYMPSSLTRNSIYRAKRGLWLSNNGNIGYQGDMSHNHYNKWYSCITDDTYTSGSTTGANSRFYVRNNINEKPLFNNHDGNSTIIPFTISNNTTPPPFCSYPLMSMGSNESENLSLQVASGSMFLANEPAAWLAKHSVYQKLLKDTANTLQLIPNSILQNFKDSIAQAPMGQLEEVNKQLPKPNLSPTELQNLYNFNQSIAPVNNIENNSKAVNEILINIRLNKQKVLDSLQLAFLKDLATMCPFVEGKPVYQARVLLSHYDNLTTMYSNPCEFENTNSSKKMPVDNTGQSNFAEPIVKVYPNPASTALFIEIKAPEFTHAVFKLYNMLGQNVLEQALEDNSESFYINISKFKAGYYNYSVSINDKVVSSDRIIIIK